VKSRFPKKKNKKIALIMLITVFLLITFSYYIVEKDIKPTIQAMSEIKARLTATRIISEAVSQKIMTDSFSNVLNIRTDNQGKITMVQSNTVEMNKLAFEISIAIQNQLKDIELSELKIPIGSVFGSQIFANTGPYINIDIKPAGSVNIDFKTEFDQAGINQTRFTVYLIVKAVVQIIVPLVSNSIEVSSHIPVVETIIVGDVPESYINVPSNNQNYLDLIPIKNPFDK